jgi:hypothetical protein
MYRAERESCGKRARGQADIAVGREVTVCEAIYQDAILRARRCVDALCIRRNGESGPALFDGRALHRLPGGGIEHSQKLIAKSIAGDYEIWRTGNRRHPQRHSAQRDFFSGRRDHPAVGE